jgi:hypothetical protein
MSAKLNYDDLWEKCPNCDGAKSVPNADTGVTTGIKCPQCVGEGKVPTETAISIVRLMKKAMERPELFPE